MNTVSEISKVQTKAQSGLKTHGIFMIAFLVIQYVLGMVTTMYVQFPDTTQPDKLWAAARSQFPSAAHIVLGTLLLVAAVVFVIRAAKQKNQRWIRSSVAGLIAILVAVYGGVTFTTTQNDIYSIIMAFAFIAAPLAYGWGLYATNG